MNLSKLFATIFIILISILPSFSIVNASVLPVETQEGQQQVDEKIEGGPRDVVQNMASVTILQPQTDMLYITVVKANGDFQCKATSDDLSIVISTEGWDAGDYVIETMDDSNVYQEFYITIN